MSDRPINQPFISSGEWFLPDNPDSKIAGSLNYDLERIELNLLESFKPLTGTIRFNETNQSYPVIHGISQDGEAMTLFKAQRARWSIKFGTGGLRKPEMLVSPLLIIGAHLPSDFLYPEMHFRVPGLQTWLSHKIIEQILEENEETGAKSSSYKVQSIGKESFFVPSIDATLEWAYSWGSHCDHFTSINVTVSAWITFKPKIPQTIEWYFNQLGKISSMLAFLADTPMSTDLINASIGDGYQNINVMVTLRNTKYCLYTNLHEFFMTREEMGVDLADVVTRWFELYPKIHMPCQLALSILASENLWLHVEFLSYMQALEGLHRAMFEGNYIDEDQYELVKKALSEAIPADLSEDHKASLRSRIRYGNQVSLSKRLNELARSLPEKIRKFVLGSDGKIPRSWIDTRNYYTHWDEELRSNVLDGQGMYNAHLRLRHFLRILYINLMGIPEKSILISLQNACSTSQHLAQLNMREFPESNKIGIPDDVVIEAEQTKDDAVNVEYISESPQE